MRSRESLDVGDDHVGLAMPLPLHQRSATIAHRNGAAMLSGISGPISSKRASRPSAVPSCTARTATPPGTSLQACRYVYPSRKMSSPSTMMSPRSRKTEGDALVGDEWRPFRRHRRLHRNHAAGLRRRMDDCSRKPARRPDVRPWPGSSQDRRPREKRLECCSVLRPHHDPSAAGSHDDVGCHDSCQSRCSPATNAPRDPGGDVNRRLPMVATFCFWELEP